MKLRDNSEWRTLFLITVVYVGWLLLLWNPIGLPALIIILFLIPLITLHSSLQHECLHGHPFIAQRWNDFLVAVPLGIYVPYHRFKESHMKHHHDSKLTDPYEDPESWYKTPQQWQKLSAFSQKLLKLNNTLIGRVVLGPIIGLAGFIRAELKQPHTYHVWAKHLLAVVLLLLAVSFFTDLAPLNYLFAAYVGYSLLTIRTFLEHQADENARARTVLIEDSGLLSKLFLNNNLHAVHHAYPLLPWYKLPNIYKKNRQRFIALNHGYYFQSYREVWRKFAFRTKESVVHPFLKSNQTKKGAAL